MDQSGNVETHDRDVNVVENVKSDDGISLDSIGQAVSRDRQVAERMYSYYWPATASYVTSSSEEDDFISAAATDSQT